MNPRALDKFYTQPHIAQSCFDHLQDSLPRQWDLWLEPSAGNGSFFSLLPEPKLGLDLHPDCQTIKRKDFFTWKGPKKKSIIAIGNPPFGRNASLAVRFFNHAALYCDTIAFIVPKSFEKLSIQNRLDLRFSLVSKLELPDTSFTFNATPYHVPCIFQVWTKTGNRERLVYPLTHQDFTYTTKELGWVALQRVGANAGKVKTDFDNCAPRSHYFLKSHTLDKKTLINRLSTLNFNAVKYMTAGNPSVSKTELVQLYKNQYG